VKRLVALLSFAVLAPACADEDPSTVPVEGRPGARKTVAVARAERRAYDGAPPVIPHVSFGAACTSCHTERGLDVEGVGFAPPMPHERTRGMSALSMCTQCHVFQQTTDVLVATSFEGLPQDLRPGARAYEGAPPVMPHPAFLRENCRACHAGPAAREEIRTTHPERQNCRQCHVER